MNCPICKTCKWWGEVQTNHDTQTQYAKCLCPKLDHRLGGNGSDGAVDAEEYGGIYTGPDFGCVHHESK